MTVGPISANFYEKDRSYTKG